MHKVARIFLILLSFAVGCVFLYSAYTKLFPIQSFEYTMVEFGHLPWLVAAIAARGLIGLEAALGGLMVLHLFGKGKWVLKTALVLTVVFSLYLVYLWITVGNDVNCGCFGDAIWMSPAASLIKNVLLIIAIGLLIRYHLGFTQKWAAILSLSIGIATVAAIFILQPIPYDTPNWLKKDSYTLDLSPLYDPGKKDKPDTELRSGKHIIAFLSASCPHCRIAAQKMHIMKEHDPSLPFFMVIGGSSDLDDFWKHTKAQNIPYTRLEKEAFYKLAGTEWPAIFLVTDSRVDAKITYISLNENVIHEWIKK